MNSEPSDDRAGGLQAERTSLAWQRTSLAAVVAALLALRAAVVPQPTWTALLSLAAVVVLLAATVAGLLRVRALRHGPALGEAVLRDGRVPAVFCLAALAAGLGSLLVLLGLHRG